MARQNINIGTVANDRSGDPLRTAFSKTNSNFIELYSTDTTINTRIDNLDIADLSDNQNLLNSGSGNTVISTSLPYLELTNNALIVLEPILAANVEFTKENYATGNSAIDYIDENLHLTRGSNGGLYNIALEESFEQSLSPKGTLWNADGWDNISDYRNREYVSFRESLNNEIGDAILDAELIMFDVTNNKYYQFDFHSWTTGGNGGGFSYTRREIIDPNFFKKEDYSTDIDILVENDENNNGVAIARNFDSEGIFNQYQEEYYDSMISPAGTLWNNEGWDDFSNVQERQYTSFLNAYNYYFDDNILGSRSIMYIPSVNKYYAIWWTGWSSYYDGGGFSYYRYEIDLNKINEGIRFNDNSVLRSAVGLGRVKSTASGKRRIEEVVGSKTVHFTDLSYFTLTSTASRSQTDSGIIYISNDDPIINISDNYDDYVRSVSDLQFSLDNATWYSWSGSRTLPENENGYYFEENPVFSYNQGDTIYFRYQNGGLPVVWWDKRDLPGGSNGFRGAIIDYHAYTGNLTWIGTIYIADDSGNRNTSHIETYSGNQNDREFDDLWHVEEEGTLSYRRTDFQSRTAKIHWSAKVFYGDEYYD